MRCIPLVLNLNGGLDHAGLHDEDDVLARLIDGHETRSTVAERAAASSYDSRRSQVRARGAKRKCQSERAHLRLLSSLSMQASACESARTMPAAQPVRSARPAASCANV